MTNGVPGLLVELPVPEAGELVSIAARLGVSVQKYLGYHVLKSAYGPLHPEVAEFEKSRIGRVGE